MASSPKNALKPVDWPAMYPHYRAGIRSLKALGEEFGVAPPSILKHMRKHGIVRDLKARILAETERKVQVAEVANADKAKALANGTLAKEERVIIGANSDVASGVLIGQRKHIARGLRVTGDLLQELEQVVAVPDAYAMVLGALDNPDEPALESLRGMARLVESLPARLKMSKDAAEAMAKWVGMQREAFGLDTAAGTDGRPTVIIHDWTGRGSAEAPVQPKRDGEDEGPAR